MIANVEKRALLERLDMESLEWKVSVAQEAMDRRIPPLASLAWTAVGVGVVAACASLSGVVSPTVLPHALAVSGAVVAGGVMGLVNARAWHGNIYLMRIRNLMDFMGVPPETVDLAISRLKSGEEGEILDPEMRSVVMMKRYEILGKSWKAEETAEVVDLADQAFVRSSAFSPDLKAYRRIIPMGEPLGLIHKMELRPSVPPGTTLESQAKSEPKRPSSGPVESSSQSSVRPSSGMDR